MIQEAIKKSMKFDPFITNSRIIAVVLALVSLAGLPVCKTPAEGQLAQRVEKVRQELERLDPAMGDWQGSWISKDGTETPLVAQVIALGDRKYQANLFEEFDRPNPPIAVLKGQFEGPDPKVHLKGQSEAGSYCKTQWQGIINLNPEGNFTGTFKGPKQGRFMMRKIFRLPPTLGAKPPAGAIVLFDGTNFDQWEHPRGVRGVNQLGGFISLSEIVGGENCAAYLRSRIWSEKQQQAVLESASDDGIKAWLNGQLVHANNVKRTCFRWGMEDRVNVTLKQGWNELMLKVVNYTGDWAATARLVAGGKPPDTVRLKNIGEADLHGQSKQGTRKYLQKNDDYLTEWQVSGPYRQEGKSGEEIFDIAFAPEDPNAKDVLWRSIDRSEFDTNQVRWKLVNGAMEVRPGSTSIITKRKFTDFKVHVEFRTPFMPEPGEQGRGNSGVFPQARYEVQILDSYGLLERNEFYCGGLFGTGPPSVNMCAPQMHWQTYDITYHAPRFDRFGRKIKHARMTVIHNGVKIHDDVQLYRQGGAPLDSNFTEPGGLMLQEHGARVQFANIWLVELPEETDN